jgi:hypothetical protein
MPAERARQYPNYPTGGRVVSPNRPGCSSFSYMAIKSALANLAKVRRCGSMALSNRRQTSPEPTERGNPS